MTAATTTPARVAEREVDWRTLAALVADHDGLPGYSHAAGRAYLHLDGVLVWADCTSAVLDPAVPGANAIATARLAAYTTAERARDDAWLASLTDDQRAREHDVRRAIADTPDPPQWQVDAYCDRHGIWEFR